MLKPLFDYTFLHPWVLWTIPILWILFGLWYYFFGLNRYAKVTFSSLKGLENHNAFRGKLIRVMPFLRVLALSLILVALARPQSISTDEKVSTFGIDIVLSIDISGSMLAKDFKPDRIQATKKVAADFIDNRSNDRIGLVLFAAESFTQVPVTSDHRVLKNQLDRVEYGMLQDGTAIGMGIGSAVNRLKDSDAKSKVIILMTDGENNAGIIDPITATEAAMQFDIKIYTIGVGSKGQALMPAYRMPNGQLKFEYMPVNIDEDLLKKISKMTHAKYFRAQDEKELQAIYDEIDLLEKTEIESSKTVRVSEKFHPFAAFAIFLFLFELLMRYLIVRIYS